MNNSFKNNYSGKNRKQNKKNSNFYPNTSSSSKKNTRFANNSSKNKNENNFNKGQNFNSDFSIAKKESLLISLMLKFLTKLQVLIMIFLIKEILMIGYGENIQFLRLSIMRELLIGYGVQQKSFHQKNFILY